MRKIVVFAFALAAGMVVYAQKVKPSSNVISEQRTVLNFSQLSVSNGIEVSVSFTGSEKVEIQAPDNVVQFIETVVEKDVLSVRFRKGFKLQGNAAIKVSVNAKSLTKITAVNKSKITLEQTLTANKLDVKLTDAVLTGTIAVQKASFALAKEAQANLSGTCKDLKMELSGKSNLGNTSFTADAVVAKLSGQCTARLAISGSVEFSGAKGSNLYYLGNPALKKIKASGDSGIRTAN
ncbi:MAG: DUF2807 domain-containing protein [Lentimicrobiaceae bacterium]|nr:DUF2807 domain-containing protein [Lentimicrobiaceae bacterium]